MTDVDALLSRGFRQGTEAAKEAASRGPSGRKVDFLRMNDGDLIFVRFLTDFYEITECMVHSMYPTKPKPEGYTGTWPKTVSAVCRNSKMKDGAPMFPDGCYCCQHPRMDDGKPRGAIPRTYGLMVVREEVVSDGTEAFLDPRFNPPQIVPKGQRAGFRDKKREYQPFDFNTNQPVGGVEMIPDVLMAEMGWNNFWSDIEGISQLFGTICNQEMSIRRTGSGMNDTKYHIVGLGINKHDMRDPQVLAKYGIEVIGYDDLGRPIKKYPKDYSLGHIIYARASDEYFARWIDPTKSVEKSTAGVEQVVAKTPVEEVSQASLEAMRARLVSSTAPVEPTPAPAPTAAPAPVPEPVAAAPTPEPTSVPAPPVVATNGAPQVIPAVNPPVAGDLNFE
jgi:hypothetical protein